MTPIQELIHEMESLKKTKLYQGSFKAIQDCIHLAYAKIDKEPIEPKSMNKQSLIDIGFTEIPHFTITSVFIYDLGRNRHLSFGCIGTPNEMLFICEIDKHNLKKITDVVCLRNYDYDGYTTIEEIEDIIKALKKQRNENTNTN